MKSVQFFSNIIKSNSIIKSTLKKVVSVRLRNKIYKLLNKDNTVTLYYQNKTAFIDLENEKIKGLIPVYYWDGEPNFGDLIGPYLVSKITGTPVLNIKNLKHPGIMTVGSIIQMIDRKDMVIWGSGLMYKLKDTQINSFKDNAPYILSVRGQESAQHLIDSGISVPDQKFYGDPALILPLFYTPSIRGSKKIGICPHYIHKPYFLKSLTGKDNLRIINVQNDVETVVDEIASSAVCISTSLHGLIIAQAYGIPWVWLEVCDKSLSGGDFKFKDFFSTLNEAQVSHIKVNLNDIESIDYEAVADKAVLPDKLYSEQLILEAFESYLNN
ncbi:polysaccharide pyruvyl transferase family protein [Psychrobacter sp. GW64-MNA-CIBAN-0177]|uniref:polysaccharide pyruvyl transferase family protein n=1 Tax=Psychrobacter sp. GW64-MNA-CIBAN-0177 TaxID=3140449 RepID=UPI00332DBBFA